MHRLMKLLPLVCLALILIASGARPAFAVTDAEIATITTKDPAATPAATNGEAGGLLGDANPEAPSLGGMAARLAIALGVVFAIMAGVLWAARRWLPGTKVTGRNGVIEITAAKQLGQRRSLLLVRTQGRTLLLGVTAQSINVLSDWDAEPLGWSETARRAGLPDEESRGTTDLGGYRPESQS